jgi:polyisoprenoid-binding protein YceI
MNANKKDVAELKGMYVVDGAHSSVDFSVKHVLVDTKGTIMIDSGFVNLENVAGTKLFVQLDMTSLTTQNAMRDEHLKDKPEFFNVAKFKKAIFESSEVIKNEEMGEFTYAAKGKLTIKGVTKDATLLFNYAGTSDQDWGDGKKFKVAGFEGEFSINRKDFSIEGEGAAEEVEVEFTIEATQPIK